MQINKRALLIGIDKYQFMPEHKQLEGCVNDVGLMREALIKKFGFDPKNIKTLTDEEATQENILKHMDLLAENCGQDDLIVFFFSGHGSQFKKIKPTGHSETIMPYDCGREFYGLGGKVCDIKDDKIYSWLVRLSKKTSNIVLIFDSCFAGSIVREGNSKGSGKGVDGDDENDALPNAFPLEDDVEMPAEKGPSGWLPVSKKYTLLAASREYEGSNPHRDKEGKPCGLFTYYLHQALMAAEIGDTFRDVWENLVVGVKKVTQSNPRSYVEQSPQLEGNWDRELFGTKDIFPFRYLSVTERQGERIMLSGGVLQGVTVDSLWEVYPAGTKSLNKDKGNVLGKIKIISTKTNSSEAVPVEEQKTDVIKEATRAVRVSRDDTGKSFRVFIEKTASDFAEQTNKLEALLGEFSFITIVDEKDLADARIHIESGGKNDKVAEEQDNYWLVYGRDDKLLMPPRSVDNSFSALDVLGENLGIIYDYERILDLKNQHSLLEGKIDFIILKQNADQTWEEVKPDKNNGNPIIRTSERIALKVINYFEYPVFFSILDFGLSRDISLLFPEHKESQKLGTCKSKQTDVVSAEGEGIMTIGMDDDESPIYTFFPENFPFVPPNSENGVNKAGGIEVYKLIVTTRAHNASYLLSGGVRDGNETAELGAKVLSADSEEWVTIEKPFLLIKE